MQGRPGAAAINVASISGWSPQLAMSGQYGAAKAALIFDTERWAGACRRAPSAGRRRRTAPDGSAAQLDPDPAGCGRHRRPLRHQRGLSDLRGLHAGFVRTARSEACAVRGIGHGSLLSPIAGGYSTLNTSPSRGNDGSVRRDERCTRTGLPGFDQYQAGFFVDRRLRACGRDARGGTRPSPSRDGAAGATNRWRAGR